MASDPPANDATGEPSTTTPAPNPDPNLSTLSLAEKALDQHAPPEALQKILAQLGGASNPLPPPHQFKFWSKQPVPQFSDDSSTPSGTIQEQTVDQIATTPLNLPPGFEWVTCDIDDMAEKGDVSQMYTLLCNHYVEDDDNMFRFKYGPDFLQWALKPPGFRKDWHVGVRSSNGILYAIITAIPGVIQIDGQQMTVAEINILCVHKKLRAKRLSLILIKEITRRVNQQGIWHAVYTAGVVLPTPVCAPRYYHRSLNPAKLIRIGFSGLAPRMTLSRTVKLHKLPEKAQTPGWREMKAGDVVQVTQLLRSYLPRHALSPVFTEEDVAHWLLPRAAVINSYVVDAPDGRGITDMTSYYTLPSSVLCNGQITDTMLAAYMYYTVSTVTPLRTLLKDALITACGQGYDVYNALNIMENGSAEAQGPEGGSGVAPQTVLEELKFAKGDGLLHYYIFNYRLGRSLDPSDVALILH